MRKIFLFCSSILFLSLTFGFYFAPPAHATCTCQLAAGNLKCGGTTCGTGVLSSDCTSNTSCTQTPCQQPTLTRYFCGPNEKGTWSEVFKTCFCKFADLVQQIYSITFLLVSACALGMFGYGAIKYMTSQNNPDKLIEAKDTMAGALEGFVLVLLSYGIFSILSGQFAPEWGIKFLEFPW